MSLLLSAVNAKLPLLAVHTNDTVYFRIVLKELTNEDFSELQPPAVLSGERVSLITKSVTEDQKYVGGSFF